MVIRSRLLAIGIMGSAAACGGAADTVPNPVAGAATLLVVQAQVFTPRCALSGCHVGTIAPFGLDLSNVSASAASLIDVPSSELPGVARVVPGDAANSYLYWKVSGNPNINGDPMPLSGGPLSDAEVSLLASWIDGGAK